MRPGTPRGGFKNALPAEQFRLDKLADNMPSEDMRLLYPRSFIGRDGYGDVRKRTEFPAILSGHPYRRTTALLALCKGFEDIFGITARRNDDDDVAFFRERFDLPREYIFKTVIIPYRGDRRGIRRQSDGGPCRALFGEPADEFGRNVLCVGGASPVAAEQYLAAAFEGRDETLDDSADRSRLPFKPAHRSRVRFYPVANDAGWITHSSVFNKRTRKIGIVQASFTKRALWRTIRDTSRSEIAPYEDTEDRPRM